MSNGLLPEAVLSMLAIVPALFSIGYACARLLKRVKIELKIREKLDEHAAHDRNFNGIVKDANSAFTGGEREYSPGDVEEFRRVLTRDVPESLENGEKDVFRIILSKDDKQMRRYTERVAHSIAGRRTPRGRAVDRVIRVLLKLFMKSEVSELRSRRKGMRD